MTPYEAMHPTRAAVLTTLLRLHAAEGRCTVRAVADELGISISTCHSHLTALRRAGLIAWEPKRAGTLRPLVVVRSVA